MAGRLGFPERVNETSARTVAAGVVTMAAAAAATDQPWLLIPLVYGFGARVAAGPSFSPLAQFAIKVVTPRLDLEHTYSPGPPKRLAQAMGFAMSAAALVLRVGLGRRRASRLVLAALAVAAGLEAAFGICLACKLFAVGMRIGVIPESVCERCADIWADPRNAGASDAAAA